MTEQEYQDNVDDIAKHFQPSSWVILEEAKEIVENAILNPHSNIEAALHKFLHKGIDKTREEVNSTLSINQISADIKAKYLDDFQSHIKDVGDWMIKAYTSKTLLAPKLKFLEQQQKMLRERLEILLRLPLENSISYGTENLITLTEDQIEMLNWYNEQYPQMCYVSQYTIRSDKTKRNNAKFLRQKDFIERPEGKIRGDIITQKGQEYIEKYFA